MKKLAVVALVAATLTGCTYNVAVPKSYEAHGVARLNDFPREGKYRNLGIHAWGFYLPGWGEPRPADVWDRLSRKVLALGGNACIVRHEQLVGVSSRNIEITCEVLALQQ